MIVGRISLIIGKAVAIKSDGSSRELSLGDNIESDELISVSASGKIVVDTNGGEQVTVNANETWVAASSSSASSIPKSTTDASGQPLDPNSVEAIQAALLAGADPTEGAEATAAGAEGAAGAGGLGNEGSSFVRLGRGNSSAVDSGLNFETIGQAANAGQQNAFDPEVFQSVSLGGAGSGFVVYDDIGSDGLPSDTREVIVNNSSTNDSAPTLEGVGAIPGAVIRIYDNGALIASVTANPDGTWQIDTPTLSDDPHSITVTQQQPGFTESNPSAPINFIVDTQPPAALSFIATDDQGNITGPINSGDSTDDTQPTFSGSDAEAGAVIDLRDENGTSIGSTTADIDGKWSITPETPLTEGEHQITAVQTDLAGNESPVSESLEFSVKLAPDAPVLNSIIDDVGLQTGEIENATSTDDSRPVISGTAEAGSTITLLDNGQIVGTAIVDSQGNWSAEPNIPLNTGDHSITVTATNEMGNVSEESSPARTFTVDLPGPDAPSIENVIDDVDPQQGNISKGTGVTDDTTPTVTGSAQAGAIVTLYDADKNILGTDVADDDGNWSIAIADSEALSEGMQSITAKAVLNNVESPETGAYIFEVDTSTPSKPGPLIITDDQGETVGVILNNDTTDDSTPTISGSGGAPGSTISVLDGDREIGTAIVQLDGTWSVTPAAPLTDGLHSIIATETAPNGKVSEPSTAAIFTVDTSAVLVSISYISDDVEGIVGDVADNGLTNDSEPTVQGTATAGAVVAVLLGDVVIGSTTASSQGTWSFAVPTGTPLLEGNNQLTAQVQNPSDETVTSNQFNVTLDTEAPSKIDAVVGTDDVGAVQGNIPEGGKTDDPTPTFSGGGNPGDVIEIFDHGKPIGSTTVNPEGEWEFTPSTPLPPGDHSITVAPTDPAGNTGDPSDPLTFEIDIITPPSSPSIQTVQDNVGNEGGRTIDVPKTSGVTNDATPTIIGSSAPGLTVRVYNDGQLLGETTANGDGHWSFTPAIAFVDGVYKITADSIDSEGVISEETGIYDFRVDLQIPDAPSLVAHDDQGDSTGPINNQDTTDDAQPTFSGSDAEPGAVIELRDSDGMPIGSATVDNAGAWTITPVIPLTEGEHKISAVQTDAAGNESPASELTFTVDLDPNAVIITHAVDNVEQNTGNLATGARINDQTPEITGTAKADSLVRLFQDNLEIGSVTADSNGVWGIVVAELANGDYNFTATATDAANNTVTSNSFQLTIDTLASDNIGPIVVTDDVGSIQGEITDQGRTDDTTPTISGSGATPGDYIQVFDGNTLISPDPEVDPGNAVQVDEYGNWTFTPSNPLPEGEHEFTAQPVDAAGNEGAKTASVTITIDVSAPIAPSLDNIIDDVGEQTGEIDNASTTDDARPSISGTAEAGSTITLLDNGKIIGTAIVDNLGNWSTEPNIPLNTGDHSITVTATDEAGNVSAASSPARTFTVDLPGPDAPSIDNVIDDVDPQQGNISKGTGVTDDTTPTVTGSAQVGATVTLYDADKNILGTAIADDKGNWSIAIADNKALSEGMQSLTATAQLDNVESPETGAYTFSVDTSTPDKPGLLIIMDDQGPTVGIISNNDTTDDSTPTISGSGGTAGSTISVLDGDREIGTATVQADGTWSVTPVVPLGDGPHSISATETAPNGKVSEPSTVVAFTVDTSAVQVSISYINDDVEGIVGDIADNGLTNDSQPSVHGEATAGAVVTVLLGDTVLGSTTASSQGAWSFTVPTDTPLAEGANKLTAQIQNPSDETVTSNEFNVTLDLEAPSKIDPVIGTDDVGTVQGSIPEGGKTDDPTPTFSGGGNPGDVIEIFDNGKPIGSTTVNAEGEWQFTPSTPLPAGEHSITVAPTDPAGNTGDPSKPLNFAVDFTPASAVTFDEVFDNQGVKTGVLANGDITDDRTPVLKGTGTQGELITVYDQGVAIASFTVTAATGDWEYELQPSEELGDGDHSLTVTSTNDAGATTAPTAARTFSLDGTQPAAPSINSVIDNDDDGSLHIPKDTGVTNDTTPVIEGTAGANLTVRVFDDGVLLGETAVDDQGNWSFTVPVDKALEEGLHKITADAVNDVGVKSEPTGSYDFNVDITAASAPSFTADDNVGDSQGAINNNDSTDDAQPTFSGTDAEALAIITLRDADGSVLGSTKADDQGHWSITPVSALDDGEHTVSAIQTDQAGNDSLASETLTFTVDTTDVTVSITHAADNQEQHIDDIASGGITNDTTPDIVGRGKPDAIVTLTQDGTVIGSVAVDSNGDWSIAVPTLTDNKLYTFVAQAKDANGNQVSTGNFELTLDTQGPTAIDAITVSDDVGAIQGQLNDGDSSDDPTPTIAGKNATPDDIIEILDDGTVIGSATVDALGNWTFTPENGLPEGAHKFSARPVDPAGNIGPETAVVNITLDFTPPPAPVITQVTDDVGVAPDIGEIDNGETTDDARPTFSGTAEADSTITLLDDGVVIGTAIVDAQGNWSAEPEIPLNTGDHSITVIATDAAGNTSPASEARTFTVDLPGPDAPAIDNVIDDVDPQQGNISKGTGVTDDTTPTVTGSAQIGATVTLYDADQNILGTALTDDQGNWSIAIADNKALSEGMQSLTAKAELDNVESPETGAYTFKVDSSTPDAPSMKVMDDIGATQGEITTTDPVTVTDDATPTLTGTDGTPGSVITVKDGDNVIGTATVDKDGKWSVTPTEPLGKGPHSLTSTETGPNGKVSDPSPAVVFNVDVSDVEVSITRIVDDVEGIVGNISDNGLTNDAQPSIEGTATAGAVVSIYINAEKKGEATADSKGNWSFSLPAATPLVEGANSIEAQIQNPSDETVTSNEFNVTLDLEAPSKIDPVIGTDDVGTVQGSIPEGGKTDDPTPTFSGGGNPGDVIEIFDNGKPIGSTTVNAEGEWQFTPSTPLPAGEHSITVAPTDPAGNTGDPSKPLKFEIDITADDIAINITEIIDNVPMQVGDISDGGLTNDITPELKGTLDQGLPADGKVEILRDGIVIGVATTVGTDWSYTDAALQDGQTYVYTARVSDTAGNVAGVSTSRSIQIDAANPDTPIVDLSTRSDSTLVGLESLDHILKHDDFTIFKQLEFDGNTDASEAGSIVYYYAYATNASKNSAGNLTDEGTYHDLLQETTSGNEYTAQHKFLLGSAEVRADGSWTMKMTDTEDNPLLSKVKSVDANGNEIAAQYFIHVDAQIVDTAGNQSSLSSALKITIETTDKNDQTRDPLILDLDGDGIHTVSINDGITFDHDGDGVKENSGWVSSTDGLLVRDINNDGLITSGSELFGDNTALSSGSNPAADGYEALADLDSNHDNVINSLDDKFSELKVWIDADQDGITDSGELKSLAELGITELSLDYKEVTLDEFGNQIIKQSSFVQNSETKTLSDVDLAAGPSSGGISFVNLVSEKELVGSADVGDGSSQASNLSLKVVVPPLSLAGEYFFITIDGPAGVTRVTHLVTAQDVSTGEVVFPLPNNALQTNNSYVDGDYSLSLVVSTVAGAVTPYPGIVTFTLDTIAPDAPSNVEIVNGADDYLDTDELAENVTVKVTLTANAKVGDVLEIDVSGDGVADATYIIQSADIGNSVELAIAGALFNVNSGTNQVSAVATLIDPANNSSSQTVGMSDVVLNIDPIANDDTYTLNQAIELQVLSNDTDQDNDSLSVSAIKTAPEHGTVVINANGTITYTPDAGYVGDDQFEYEISDGKGGTDTANVNLEVFPQLSKPSIDLAASSDSGKSNTDNITNDNTPRLVGKADANVTVTVYEGNTKIGETTTDDQGHWFIESTLLNDGTYALTAISSIGGFESPASNPLSVQIDTVVDASMSLPSAQEAGAWFGHAPQVKFELTTTEHVQYSVKDVAFSWGSRVWYNPGHSITANGEAASSTIISASHTSQYSHGWFTFQATLTDVAGNVKTTNLTPVVVDPIASLKDGGYIVTYLSPSAATDGLFDVHAQRYDVNGDKVGDSFVVNSYLKNQQINADVTGLEDGGFVVTWQSEGQDGDGFGIYAQRYDVNNLQVGDEFQVSSYEIADQVRPEITSLADGGYVISWMSYGQDGSENGIYMQIFNQAGEKVSAEILVNTSVASDQALPSITHLDNGDFVVSWQSNHDGEYNVYGRIFNSQGIEVKSEFIISSSQSASQVLSNISNLADGGFVTSWLSQDTSDNLSINVQLFNQNGMSVLLNDIVISKHHEVVWSKPEVAGLNDGSFVVIWAAVDDTDTNIYLSKYDVQGEILLSEQIVNSEVQGIQSEPHVVALEDGGYLITWTDIQIEGETMTIMGQQYDADDQLVKGQFEVGKVISSELAASEIGDDADHDTNQLSNLLETETISYTEQQAVKFEANDYIATSATDISASDILDISFLLESGDVQMDSLDHYLHFEQAGDDLLVYIDENGSFSAESFDQEAASQVITLADTHIMSTDYEDIMKELIGSNKIVIDI